MTEGIVLGKKLPKNGSIRLQYRELLPCEREDPWTTLDNCDCVNIKGTWYYPKEELND